MQTLPLLFNLRDVEVTQTHSAGIVTYLSEQGVSKTRSLTTGSLPLAHVTKEADRASEAIGSLHKGLVETQALRTLFQSARRSNEGMSRHWVLPGSHFSWDHNQIQCTTVENDFGQPLWYGHKLPLGSTSIRIINEQGEVPSPRYSVRGVASVASPLGAAVELVLCHNIEARAFVEFTVGRKVFVRLLNKDLLFKETQEIISPFYGQAAELFVYRRLDELERVRFELPETAEKIFVREEPWIAKAHLPPVQFTNEPWYFVIPELSLYSQDRFATREYYNETLFDLGFPYRKVIGDYGKVLPGGYIQVSYRGIQREVSSSFVDIELFRDGDSKPFKLITSEEARDRIWNSEKGLSWTYDANLSVSSIEALIHLSTSLEGASFARVGYPIEERFVTYRNIELNPFFNPDLQGKKIILYLKPLDLSEESLQHLVVNQNGKILEASDVDLASWVGKFWEEPRSVASSQRVKGSFPFAWSTEAPLKPLFDDWNYLILAEYSVDRGLTEQPTVTITNLDEVHLPSLDACISRAQHLLSRFDNADTRVFDPESDRTTWHLPELKNTKLAHIHWTDFKDYTGEAYGFFWKDMLRERIQEAVDADLQVRYIWEGVPCLEVERVGLVNCLIRWVPVLRDHKDRRISGLVFISTTPNGTGTLVATIPDLSLVSAWPVAFGGDDTIYVRIRPRIEIDGEFFFGPTSNVLCISKEIR